MSGLNREGFIQKWARLGLKCGLLFTDAKLWESIRRQVRDHVDDAGSEVRRRYAETSDRLDRAQNAYQGGGVNWAGQAASFLGGVGLGVGLGLLLAPASGQQTRSAIRDKVVELKNRVRDKGTETSPLRAAMRPSPTGTGTD